MRTELLSGKSPFPNAGIKFSDGRWFGAWLVVNPGNHLPNEIGRRFNVGGEREANEGRSNAPPWHAPWAGISGTCASTHRKHCHEFERSSRPFESTRTYLRSPRSLQDAMRFERHSAKQVSGPRLDPTGDSLNVTRKIERVRRYSTRCVSMRQREIATARESVPALATSIRVESPTLFAALDIATGSVIRVARPGGTGAR